MKIFLRQIYSYNFYIFKLNNLRVIHVLYYQGLTQTLSKMLIILGMEGVCAESMDVCILYLCPCTIDRVTTLRNGCWARAVAWKAKRDSGGKARLSPESPSATASRTPPVGSNVIRKELMINLYLYFLKDVLIF